MNFVLLTNTGGYNSMDDLRKTEQDASNRQYRGSRGQKHEQQALAKMERWTDRPGSWKRASIQSQENSAERRINQLYCLRRKHNKPQVLLYTWPTCFGGGDSGSSPLCSLSGLEDGFPRFVGVADRKLERLRRWCGSSAWAVMWSSPRHLVSWCWCGDRRTGHSWTCWSRRACPLSLWND